MKLLRYAWGLPVAAAIVWLGTAAESQRGLTQQYYSHMENTIMQQRRLAEKKRLAQQRQLAQRQASRLTWPDAVNLNINNLWAENEVLRTEIDYQSRQLGQLKQWCEEFSADVERQFKERKDWGEQVENTLTQLRYECRD